MIKHIEPGLFLDTKTGNMKYSSVVAACINYDLKQRYKTFYTTTVGLSGIQWGADLD
jgi:hypothetical protein